MPLDPSISLQAKGIALPDPIQQYGNVLGLQQAQQALQSNALQFGQAQQAAAETNALRARVSQPDFAGLAPSQQVSEIQRVAPISGQPIVDKMIANRKTLADTTSTEQGTAQKADEKAVSAFVAQPDLKKGVQALLDGVQSGAWGAKDVAPLLGHVVDGTVSDQNFDQTRQALKLKLLSPKDSLDATTPTPTQVDNSQGGKTFVDTNARTNPGIVGTSFAGTPKPITGPNGDMLTASPDGRTVTRPTYVEPGSTPVQTPRDTSTQIAMNEIDQRALKRGFDNASTPEEKASYARAIKESKQSTAGPYPVTVPPDLVVRGSTDPTVKNYNAPEDAKNAAKYEADLNESVTTNRQTMSYNDAFQKALEHYQTGPGAETRLAVAKAAAAIGVPKDMVEKINRGSIADAQEIQKLAGTSALTSLKAAMDGQGKIAQAEFRVFLANNPNIELDPNAIQKMHEFQAKQYQRVYAEQQAFSDYRGKGGDPSKFPAVWSRMLDQTGLAQPATNQNAVGTPGGTLAPPTPQKPIVRTGRDKAGNVVVQYADGTYGYGK